VVLESSTNLGCVEENCEWRGHDTRGEAVGSTSNVLGVNGSLAPHALAQVAIFTNRLHPRELELSMSIYRR
jgi:hypothetical protein